MAAPRLILVDGSAYIFRAFFAIRNMNRKDGTPTNAVYGFTTMMMKLMEDENPEYIIVALDSARETFRNEIYPDYKANRDSPPEELVPQFALVRDAIRALNLPVAELPGFEADDLIATYAKQGEAKGMEVVIVSSDKDLMQLVRPGVTMLDPMKQKRIARDEVLERFGVPPEKVVDVQALAGDSTDNVPGVPGIGVKTAAELINTFGGLDELLARAGEIKQPKRRDTLIENADQARVSRELVRLREDAPVPVDIADAEFERPEAGTLRSFLAEQDFNSLLRRVEGFSRNGGESSAPAKEDKPVPPDADGQYTLVDTVESLKGWVAEAGAAGVVAVDTETTSLTASMARLVGVSMATAEGRACYVPLRHGDAGGEQNALDLDASRPKQIPFDDAMAILGPMLADPAILKIGHNIKYDMHVLSRQVNGGCRVYPVDDTMCLSFVLDAGRRPSHKLDDLVSFHLGHEMIKFEDVCGKGAKQIGFHELTPGAALDYAAEDADYTLRLWSLLKQRLVEGGKTSVYERLERPLIEVIAAMEAEGVKVDRKALDRMSRHFAARLEELAGEIYKLAGEEFNIASPKQLGEILFGKMGLQGGKKSKTGAWSTSADVLDDLVEGGSEIAGKVLEWRQMAKLKSTYADALVTSIHPDTGRVHTSFSMVGASTGRLSSSDPNLQNIPIRTPEGRQIRTAFVPENGSVLVSADYSQIELRLVAHIASEESMLEAFNNGVDIHAQTASEVFSVALEDMTPETRRRAKAINFGIIYGISGFGLARQLGIPQGEARDFIKAYLDRFPGIRTYMDDMKAKAKEEGFVETLFGRRLYINDIKSSNPSHRGFAERQAINAPIQGTAADIIKQAMVRMPEALERAGSPARMLLQVHDELVFECPAAAADDAIGHIRSVMESAASPALNLGVPLTVEASVGKSWDEAH